MDGIRITARYGILCKCNGFSVIGRGNVLPIKGLVGEILNLINLLFAKSGGDRGTEGTINVVNVLSGAFIKKALVTI